MISRCLLMAAATDEDPGPISFSIPGRWPVYSCWVWTVGEGVVHSAGVAWALTAYQGLNGGRRQAAALFSWSSLSSGRCEDRRNPHLQGFISEVGGSLFHTSTHRYSQKTWDPGGSQDKMLRLKRAGLGSRPGLRVWERRHGQAGVMYAQWSGNSIICIFTYTYICEICTYYQIVYVVTAFKALKD